MGNEKLTTLARRLRPFFTAQVQSMISSVVLEGADIDLVATSGGVQVGRGGDQIITFDYDAGGALNPVAEYAADNTGFALALADANSVVWLYGMTLGGNFTIPAGKRVVGNQRDTTIFSGLISLGDGSSVENLSVIRAVNDTSALIGVGGPTTGIGYIRNCRISVTQNGSGAAYAVAANAGYGLSQGDLHIHHSELEGTSVGGVGYCGLSSAGRLYVWHTKADVFTTDRWLVS